VEGKLGKKTKNKIKEKRQKIRFELIEQRKGERKKGKEDWHNVFIHLCIRHEMHNISD